MILFSHNLYLIGDMCIDRLKKMNSRTKKILKLTSILISSLVIGIASASTYNMFMNATVGVTATEMSFVASTDFSACGGVITDNNQKVTFSTMNGKAGVEAIYKPVNITNGATAAHNIELVLDSWTGATQTHLYKITVSMYKGTVQQGVSLVLYPDGEGTSVTNSTTVNIGTSETWQVEWKVYWKGTAVVGDTVQVNLLLVVKS
jgi:hypothetical protein